MSGQAVNVSLIGAPEKRSRLNYPTGNTQDIVKTILAADKAYNGTLKGFAQQLQGQSRLRTLYNIWAFVKQNITYREDPSGYQFIRTPRRLWADRVGDCKSFSLFTGACLRALGIPYSYRFVSYGPSPIWTHIYVVADPKGSPVILDSVWKAFNQEKPYTHKLDIPMSEIHTLSGIGSEKLQRPGHGGKLKSRNVTATRITLPEDLDVSEGEMEAAIALQNRLLRAAIAKKRSSMLKGIGNVETSTRMDMAAEQLQDQADVMADTLDALSGHEDEIGYVIEDVEEGRYKTTDMFGIGAPAAKRAAKKQERQTAKAQKKATGKQPGKQPKTKAGQLIKKVATGYKKALKTVAKVATAPARLAIKGLLEVSLPKASPFFLYLFVNDPALLKKLPTKAREQRVKAEKLAKFITEVVGMKPNHFMGILRNGILKQFGKDPEKVIADQLKGVAGIGIAPAIIAAIGPLVEIIKKIASLFGKKAPVDVSEKDAPDPGDFATTSPAEKLELAKEIQTQAPDAPEDPDQDATSAGGRNTNFC